MIALAVSPTVANCGLERNTNYRWASWVALYVPALQIEPIRQTRVVSLIVWEAAHKQLCHNCDTDNRVEDCYFP